MNKYLIEILKIQSSVILPGLGALMVPSSKSGKIVFNQHLKFNDGSLANFIAEKEGVDAQEAQNKVAKFVREIEADLGKGKSYDMFEFGKFSKNADGEVTFEMYNEKSTSTAEDKESKVKKDTKAPIVTPADILAKEKEEADLAAKKLRKEEKRKEKEAAEAKAKLDVARAKALESEKKAAEKLAAQKELEEAKKDATEKAKIEAEKIATEKAKIDALKEAEALKKAALEKENKQTKNTFIPPVKGSIDKVKEEGTEVVESIKGKAHEIKDKIAASLASTDKTSNAEDDKKSKNKFVPTDKKEETNKAAIVAGAAVAGTATIKAIGDKTSKTVKATGQTIATKTEKVVEKVKETTIIKEEKKRSKLPWLILLLLLIGLGVAGFFYKDKILAYFNKGNTTIAASDTTDENDDSTHSGENNENGGNENGGTNTGDVTNTEGEDITTVEGENIDGEDSDRLEEDTVLQEEDVRFEAINTSGSTTGNYHVIGNAFAEKENADRYLAAMEAKGFPASIVGKFDGLYIISLKSFDRLDEALVARKTVMGESGRAWVFQHAKK